MSADISHEITFQNSSIAASFMSPEGTPVENRIEIPPANPITGRTARISVSRSLETEPGTENLPPPPPEAFDTKSCPFCPPQVYARTPTLQPEFASEGRLICNESILFPNLFPYGSHSAVSLFGADHFVEIGTATLESYADCFINCGRYLGLVRKYDSKAVFMAITQNHLPSAGGSLVHPHLQIQADRIAANHHRFLCQRAADYEKRTGRTLFSDLLGLEKTDGARYVGKTGAWEWFARVRSGRLLRTLGDFARTLFHYRNRGNRMEASFPRRAERPEILSKLEQERITIWAFSRSNLRRTDFWNSGASCLRAPITPDGSETTTLVSK